MKTLKIALFCLFAVGIAAAQSAVPNTTLCAAVTKTVTSICLTATSGSSPNWSIVNQTGIYVDQEYMLVNLTASQVISGSNTYVPVSRNNRNAGSGPTAHASGSITWIATTPSTGAIPGVNGFAQGTNVTDIGTCTRASTTFLPHIWVNRGIKRDCTTTGYWVDFAPLAGLDYQSPSPQSVLSSSQALSVSSGNYLVTKAGVAALTLAAPTSGVQDGMVITITSSTAYAHTLTATTLLENGASGSPYTTATFGAYIGASITLRSYGGVWYVVTSSNVTLS